VTRTRFYTAATIDGFIADPDDGLDWLMQSDSGGIDTFGPFFADVGAFVMGSSTYEWMLAHAEMVNWTVAYAGIPCWVFTHRELPGVPGADIRFVRGEVRPVHEQMVAAAGGRDIWLVGGGELAGAFVDEGLLDELILSVAPATLGAGKPLLPRRLPPSRLTLRSVQQIGQFAHLTYTLT
jgi:dihydrofolate reductase